eukprot:m.229726 g.229726  ORF g.229726 m.229726 type:complete len:550 (+) comp11949_c0_seq1:110-1759(+)
MSMGWFGAPKEEQEKQRVYFSAIDGLKKMYKDQILPVEDMFKYGNMVSPSLTDADFDAKPQVLLLGQYSVGKTSFIRYVMERDFPGAHIGPEPTTDRFWAVMHGPSERITPGNALAVQADKPFRGLSQFGTGFLSKFESSQCPCPILESVTFVDTPGVLSGEKQRIGRSYDFVKVVQWFAEKSDLILLLFDAHKLDISDEFKRTLSALAGVDDKIRVVLNKADQVDDQQLMRVYGALMWSLGKVFTTPEVKRVYISSFNDKPFREGTNAALFEREREDLLKELRDLPRNAAVRKINDLVKRTRYVKVHALLLGHLRNQMPSIFGKSSKQQELLDNMPDVFRTVQREHHLPYGDFPTIENFCAAVRDYDFSKFPKLDVKMIEQMDKVLSSDVPTIMNQFPTEREDEARAAAAAAAGASGAAAAGGNPFDAFQVVRKVTAVEWAISVGDQTKYRNIFQSASPIDGMLPGEAAKAVLVKSKLPFEILGKIWALSDIDGDGALDVDEFAVAMHLCHQAMAGSPVEDVLPPNLVPPSKRGFSPAAEDPFGTGSA